MFLSLVRHATDVGQTTGSTLVKYVHVYSVDELHSRAAGLLCMDLMLAVPRGGALLLATSMITCRVSLSKPKNVYNSESRAPSAVAEIGQSAGNKLLQSYTVNKMGFSVESAISKGTKCTCDFSDTGKNIKGNCSIFIPVSPGASARI